MQKVLDNMKESAKNKEFEEYLMHHYKFPQNIYQCIKNKTLISFSYKLRMHSLWHRYTNQRFTTNVKPHLKTHQEILNLLKMKNGDPKEIEKKVGNHIEVALEPFLKEMEDQKKMIENHDTQTVFKWVRGLELFSTPLNR